MRRLSPEAKERYLRLLAYPYVDETRRRQVAPTVFIRPKSLAEFGDTP